MFAVRPGVSGPTGKLKQTKGVNTTAARWSDPAAGNRKVPDTMRLTESATGGKRASAAGQRPRKHRLIRHIDEVRPAACVAYVRASAPSQRRQGRLQDRLECLRQDLECRGIEVADAYTEVAPGWDLTLSGRSGFLDAIRAAKRWQARHPSKVVAVASDCRNRFVRGSAYDRTAKSDVITPRQWARLEALADGTPLVTLYDPDLPFGDVRRREMDIRKRHGGRIGRPPKVRKPRVPADRKPRLIQKAKRMRGRGRSLREIADFFGLNGYSVSHMTVQRWSNARCNISQPTA